MVDECYTSRADGEPCFQEGKVNHLALAQQNPDAAQAADTWFYPIHIMTCRCSGVGRPVAVDPDDDSAHMPSRRWR